MHLNHLNDFKNGWLVGDFSPALVNTKDVEVAVFYLKKGDKADGHFHKVSTEYNVIVSGMAIKDGKVLTSGDIFVYRPNERSYVEYLEDTQLVVIKTPATKGDKFYDGV
jgi:quercetin dioxygenase-like cupin family protein